MKNSQLGLIKTDVVCCLCCRPRCWSWTWRAKAVPRLFIVLTFDEPPSVRQQKSFFCEDQNQGEPQLILHLVSNTSIVATIHSCCDMCWIGTSSVDAVWSESILAKNQHAACGSRIHGMSRIIFFQFSLACDSVSFHRYLVIRVQAKSSTLKAITNRESPPFIHHGFHSLFSH